MEEKRLLLNSFINEIRPFFGQAMIDVILYGSYARGDYDSFSDIDLMVLTSLNDDQIKQIEDTILDRAFDYELDNDIRISINIKNKDHFKQWEDVLPYYKNIRREGIVLG